MRVIKASHAFKEDVNLNLITS